MTAMEWKDSYSVGNDRMDDQHKGLIALINALDGEIETGEVLDKLGQYVDVHFREEEALLKASGYPALAAHIEQHKTFEEWFAGQRNMFADGGGADRLREGIRSYLKVWLMNHILFTDKSYSTYVADTVIPPADNPQPDSIANTR
jgi:hemerythrin-like metal-binding protein